VTADLSLLSTDSGAWWPTSRQSPIYFTLYEGVAFVSRAEAMWNVGAGRAEICCGPPHTGVISYGSTKRKQVLAQPAIELPTGL